MRHLERSQALYAAARQSLAGGVSSDARRGVQPVPLYISHGAGPRLWDVDENEYIDYVLGQGPLILGHSYPAIIESVKAQLDRGQVYSAQHELEVEVAAAVCRLVPCAERAALQQRGLRGGAGCLAIGAGLYRPRKDSQVRGPLSRLV